MLRKALLFSIFAILSYGFWISPNLKQITAGVAIFLFGMLSLEEGFKAFTGDVHASWSKQSKELNISTRTWFNKLGRKVHKLPVKPFPK